MFIIMKIHKSIKLPGKGITQRRKRKHPKGTTSRIPPNYSDNQLEKKKRTKICQITRKQLTRQQEQRHINNKFKFKEIKLFT